MLRTIMVLALSAIACATASAQERPAVNPGTPPPNCRARVNYNLNKVLPGYVDPKGTCQPFTGTYQLVPETYAGRDYYGEEFTDAKIRQRWAVCRRNQACAAKPLAAAQGFTAYEVRDTGSVDPYGRINPDGDVDLADIRGDYTDDKAGA